MSEEAEMSDGAENGTLLPPRERLRARATRITFAALTISVVTVTVFLQGNPSQSTVMLAVWLGCTAVLYLIEVWARKGRTR